MNKYDKNAQFIEIPNGTKSIKDKEFYNYKNLEEIIIPNSVETIGAYAFARCHKLKKVILPKNLKLLEDFAFSNCKSLEEITIPSSLHYIKRGIFSYCTNLKKITMHDNIKYIDDLAFLNCRKLTDLKLPQNITSVGIKAFFGCNKIQEIFIPENLTNIEIGAFSLMSSLSKIVVDRKNTQYMDIDNVALIDPKENIIIQYAINNQDNKKFRSSVLQQQGSMGLYINGIADYAFAGSKYLDIIYLPTSLQFIGPNTFLNCPKLKDIEFFHTNAKSVFCITIPNDNITKCHIPFEFVYIDNGVTQISSSMSYFFKNAKTILLPNSLEVIGKNVFTKSKDLKKLKIPQSIKSIDENTFNKNTILEFENNLKMPASDFKKLETKDEFTDYERRNNRHNKSVFSLQNGAYYVKIDNFDTIKVTKEEINKFSSTSHFLENEPDILIDYLYILVDIYNKRTIFFEEYTKKGDLYSAIKLILKYKNINDELLFNGILMKNLRIPEIYDLLENVTPSLNRFFQTSNLFKNNKISRDEKYIINHIDKLINYCNLLEKYQLKDRFLYNPYFFVDVPLETQELFLKHYNANFKRLLINSQILNLDDSQSQNLINLLNFCKIMGVFSDIPNLNQKMCTFITEKIFSNLLPNGEKNNYQIVGNDIHRIFGELVPKDEIDLEFILFFIENYKELLSLEIINSGIIERIYDNFRKISQSSTSNRGEQRHLKVTIKKCLEYLAFKEFIINENNKDLATFLASFYTDENVLEVSVDILNESLKAPRNIFTKINYDENNNPIYNNNPNLDLKGSVNSLCSYEWLPKQNYDNLVLGKYCNCCAHVLGAGASIMWASMVLPNCQNLVIRNTLGQIIAKMTLWIDKEGQYGIFNTAEINIKNRTELAIEKIYETFMEGTKVFVETYNQNNPDKPLLAISIGNSRNALKDTLKNHNHQEITPFKAPDYAKYKYDVGERTVGYYSGDCQFNQILILNKRV